VIRVLPCEFDRYVLRTHGCTHALGTCSAPAARHRAALLLPPPLLALVSRDVKICHADPDPAPAHGVWVFVRDGDEITRKKEFGHVAPVAPFFVLPCGPKYVHATLVRVLLPEYDLAYGRRSLCQDEKAPTAIVVRR
jgi:hypothetical protein